MYGTMLQDTGHTTPPQGHIAGRREIRPDSWLAGAVLEHIGRSPEEVRVARRRGDGGEELAGHLAQGLHLDAREDLLGGLGRVDALLQKHDLVWGLGRSLSMHLK